MGEPTEFAQACKSKSGGCAASAASRCAKSCLKKSGLLRLAMLWAQHSRSSWANENEISTSDDLTRQKNAEDQSEFTASS